MKVPNRITRMLRRAWPNKVGSGHRAATLIIASVCVLGLSGCGAVKDWVMSGSTPIVSNSSVWGDVPYDELSAWVEEQADIAVAVLDQPDGWLELMSDESWETDRAHILEYKIDVLSCRPTDKRNQPHELVLELVHEAPVGRGESARKLAEYWAYEGWEVREVESQPSPQSEDQYLRADREDGSIMTVWSHLDRLGVSIYSACSDHDTVVYRKLYRGPDPRRTTAPEGVEGAPAPEPAEPE